MLKCFLGLDPGTYYSAMVLVQRDGEILQISLLPNSLILQALRKHPPCAGLFIELMASYGARIGASTLETQLWAGRFIEAWDSCGLAWTGVFRKDVRKYFQARNDAGVRQALLTRYGGKAAAKGTKKHPGPLYGVVYDMWSALAIALYGMSIVEKKECINDLT